MPRAKPADRKPELTSAQWWRAKDHKKRPDEILDNVIRQIEEDQRARYQAYRDYYSLYRTGRLYADLDDDDLCSVSEYELTQNELGSTIEALWNQVFKAKIVPAVSTSEADYEIWSRGKAYSRWLEGSFSKAKVLESVVPLVGLDCLIYGTGIIRGELVPSEDGDTVDICVHRVSPRCVYVDRLEAKLGSPRSFYEKSFRDRYELFEVYKEDRDGFYGSSAERCEGIEKCTGNDDPDLGLSGTSINHCDILTVREAWHRPSAPGAKDGRHCIWIRGCTLVDEPWDDCSETADYCFIRFSPPDRGFWGDSAVRRLASLQLHLDKLNKKIDEAQDVMGVPRIILQSETDIKKVHIDDIPGGIIVAANPNAIKEWNAECITGEIYQERDRTPQAMRGLIGISDFAADQQIPEQMRDVSGKMLERWTGEGTARNAMLHRAYEQFMVDVGWMFARLAQRAQKLGFDVVAQSPGEYQKTSIEELKFKDVMVDKNSMRLTVQPMSQIPQTFAGKVEAIERLANSPLQLNPKTAARFMEVPDLFGANDNLVSDEEIIMKNLCFMAREKKALSVLPFDNFELIKTLGTQFLNTYRVRSGADPEVAAIILEYMEEAHAFENGLGGADPNAPVPPPEMGPGIPGAPPGMAPPPGGPVPGPPMGAGPPSPAGPVGPPPQGPPPMM